MTKVILAADGTTIELPDEVAATDESLRSALTPVYPDLANATFDRKTAEGVTTVTVRKVAGTKG